MINVARRQAPGQRFCTSNERPHFAPRLAVRRRAGVKKHVIRTGTAANGSDCLVARRAFVEREASEFILGPAWHSTDKPPFQTQRPTSFPGLPRKEVGAFENASSKAKRHARFHKLQSQVSFTASASADGFSWRVRARNSDGPLAHPSELTEIASPRMIEKRCGEGCTVSIFPEKSLLELVQMASSALLPIVAFLGVIVAWRAIGAQRQINAMKAHLDYLKLAFDNPDFAFPKKMSDVDYEAQLIAGCRLKFEKYEWFVSSMLACLRLMLEVSQKRSAWRDIAILQISYHWKYLERYRQEKHYLVLWDRELKAEIDAGISRGKRPTLA